MSRADSVMGALRRERLIQGRSHADVGAVLDVPGRAVELWEQGRWDPPLSHVRAYAAYLGMCLALFGTDALADAVQARDIPLGKT